MQDRRAIAQNRFEKYKINTEEENENKQEKKTEIHGNLALFSRKGLWKGSIKTLNKR